MKKMNVKKMLVATLAMATLGVAASGLVTIAPVSEGVVASAESAKPTPATFEMIEGASVRTTAPSGIRFSTYLNKAWIDGEIAAGKTVEVGTLVIPASKLTDTTDINFNVDTANVLKYTHDKATQWIMDGDYYKVNAVLSEIPDEELATKIAAKSYVKIDNVVYDYADAQTRSIAQVAYLAKESGNEAEYLTEVLDTTIASISVSWNTLDSNYVALPVGGEGQLNVSSTAAEGVTLTETPNLADFGLAFSEGQEGDALLAIADDGAVTPVATEGTANVVVSAAGKTVGINVKVTKAESNELEANLYNGNNDYTGLVYASDWSPTTALTKEYNASKVEDGESSWRWRIGSESNRLYYSAMLGFSVGKSNTNNIDTLFNNGAASVSFNVFNQSHATDTVDLYYAWTSGRPRLDTVTDNSAKVTVSADDCGILYAGQWTTVTITKEDWSNTNNRFSVMSTVLPNEDCLFDLYFDGFVVEQGEPEPEPSGNSELEENFFNGTSADVQNAYFVYFTSDTPAWSDSFAKNTNATYIKDGDSSWEWKITSNSSVNAQLRLSMNTGAYNLDTILNTAGVESVSFWIYNGSVDDLYWAVSGGRITTGSEEQLLAVGNWTKVVITKDMLTGLSKLRFGVCSKDGEVINKGHSKGSYFSLYFDDIQINYADT